MSFFTKIGFKYYLLIMIVSIPIFGYLDTLPIRLWDESRIAINAFEMLKNGNFLVTYYEGTPDMWNTKPPLLIWLQTVLMKITGVNELSIRLPSAIAALLTCFSLFIFSIKYLKNFWLGFITVIVLVSCQGYITEHVSRTGDYDALLTLFTTLIGLFAFLFTESKKRKYIYLFFGACIGSVMTKGIAGILFLPGIFFFVLSRKELLPLLKNKHFYISFLLFIVITLGYYILREQFNPGYLNAVWENELGGRFTKALDGHTGNSWFYIKEIFTKDLLLILSALIIPGAFTGVTTGSNKSKAFFSLSIIIVISFILIISLSQTKLNWYEAPTYPWLAFLIAKFIERDFSRLRTYAQNKNSIYLKGIPYFFLFTILLIPYTRSIKRIYNPKEDKWNKDRYEVSYYLRNTLKEKNKLQHHFLVTQKDSAKPHELFYINILKNRGVNIATKPIDKVKNNETILSSEKWAKDSIQKKFLYSILDTNGNITTFKIHGTRKQNH